MKICVVIPAFNEAPTIGGLVKEIRDIGIDVVVIDDASQDLTSESAAKEGAVVIRHKKRMGKGACLRDGFNYLKTRDYDFVITMDGDGQHLPEEMPLFINKAHNSSAAVITGNRLTDPMDMPAARLFTNKLMSAIISNLCRQQIPDTQCGFRLYRKEVLDSINIESNKFEVDSELLIKASKNGYKIDSIPITSVYAKEVSKIRPLGDAFRFVALLIKALCKYYF